MASIAPGLKGLQSSRLLAKFAARMFCLSLALRGALGQNPSVGRVVGNIDGIAVDAGGAHIKGWDCQQGRPESPTVHIYANGDAHAAAKGIFALAGEVPSAAWRKNIATSIPTANPTLRNSALLSARSRIRAGLSIPSMRRISCRASAP
jgi:hypothetical protein